MTETKTQEGSRKSVKVGADISRRVFIGAMGAMGMSLAAAATGYASELGSADASSTSASASASSASAASASVSVSAASNSSVVTTDSDVHLDTDWSGSGSGSGDWVGTPDEARAIGLSTMPLDELNRRRELYVNAQTAYTCADGTVIPEVYVKFRALLNTYGHGVGSELTDTCFSAIMKEVTEEEAQAYLEMPRGHQFSAWEFSQVSGRPTEECEKYCESIHKNGWISKVESPKGTLYGQIAFLFGIEENHTPQFHEDPAYAMEFTGTYGADGTRVAYFESGTPFFITTPVSKDAVKDGAIDPVDDILALIDSKNKFAVSPCPCRTLGVVTGEPVHIDGYPDGDYDIADEMAPCGHPLETCLVLGEEAEFWIDLKVGREITKDEAKALIQRSVDAGMILERIPTKEAENICSCHSDCCGILSCWKMFDTSESRPFKQISRYRLDVDLDACIGCGTCVERCPMKAIELGDDGKAKFVDSCFACGQCTLTCPAGARILVPKTEDERMPLFQDLYDMNNHMAAERFESGLIY